MLSGSLMKKEKEAIERLQAFSAEEPYYLCYSGGKDSDTIRILAELANVNFEVHNNHTTVDTPEMQATEHAPGKTRRRFRNNRPCDIHFPKSARDKTVVQFKEPEKATRADKIIPEIQETPC